MDEFRREFSIALRGLIDGKLPLEDALAIAGQRDDIALFMVQEAFSILPSNLSNRGGFRRLLPLLWSLDDRKKLLDFSFRGSPFREDVDQFLLDRVRQSEVEFTNEMLQSLSVWKSATLASFHLRDLAAAAQMRRVKARADQLGSMPRELLRDIVEVKRRVSAYNFPDSLNELLDKVETGLGTGDKFDQAAQLKHLRTFFEKLHEQVGTMLQQAKPETVDKTPLDSCGQAIDFLRRKDLLTEKMAALAKALYGVLSNEGVHAIQAERECVRLCRNMVAEYALMLFFELDRRIA